MYLLHVVSCLRRSEVEVGSCAGTYKQFSGDGASTAGLLPVTLTSSFAAGVAMLAVSLQPDDEVVDRRRRRRKKRKSKLLYHSKSYLIEVAPEN